MNLSKFLKGCTTITEMENLPNRYIHVIYKQYVDSLKSKEAQAAIASQQIEEEMEEVIGG